VYLIMILGTVIDAFVRRALGKVMKDGTGHLMMVMNEEDAMRLEDNWRSMLAAIPRSFVVESREYICIVVTGSSTPKCRGSKEVREVSVEVATSVHYQGRFFSEYSATEISQFDLRLDVRVQVQGTAMDHWWADWKITGLKDVPWLDLKRQYFERPPRLKHCYQVGEKRLNVPGLERFLKAPPLPVPHDDAKSRIIILEVIEPNQSLFEVITVVNEERFEEQCLDLPNKPHWESYIRAFREGGNPWLGSFDLDDASGVGAPNAAMSVAEWAFVYKQRDEQVSKGHWSTGFKEPLPFMRTSPLAVTAKPGESRYRLIQNASAP
jgi:hypothetical protein